MLFEKLRLDLHRHGHHHGPGPRGPRGFGFGPGWGGPRARRGDMKYLVLEVLTDAPRHGYEIIGAIEQRRGFRPSPGSIYPTLQMLEDGGFVFSVEVQGKRVYTITPAGTEMLANRAAAAEDEDDDGEPDARHRVKQAAMKLGAAVMSARGSNDATLDKIRDVLDRARKEIYAVLASD